MDRRGFVHVVSSAVAVAAARGLGAEVHRVRARERDADSLRRASDVSLQIGPVNLEIAPGRVIKTVGYNGMVPGPVIRLAEGQSTTIEVRNDTSSPEFVHWHGLFVPDSVDGAGEEGTPHIGPHETRQYTIIPQPAGTRWYHTHVSASRDLSRAMYTGQFGFLYVEPTRQPAPYDAEVFLALHGWDGYLGTAGGGEGTLDVIYKAFTINSHMLGSGEPVRVRQGQRVMFRILNANATLTHRIALAGHRLTVVALDGNPVPSARDVGVIELGPAERVDAIASMDQPGVWVLGELEDEIRRDGLGVVVEYAGQTGAARWVPPAVERWDYTIFGASATPSTSGALPEREVVPLVFKKKFAGSRWVDNWTVNEKSFPHTDPIRIASGERYRFRLDNRSDEAHPIHLHRHTFELVTVAGVHTSGVRKDVVVVPPHQQVDVDLTANALGASLLHCHNQLHMDYGFMTVVECA